METGLHDNIDMTARLRSISIFPGLCRGSFGGLGLDFDDSAIMNIGLLQLRKRWRSYPEKDEEKRDGHDDRQ